MLLLSGLQYLSILALLQGALATLYVVEPVKTTTCTGGSPCTVSWLDDGTQPLLSSIGVCTISLRVSSGGTEHLVQQITPVDVSATHTLQFTPDPKSGPDSSEYYIQFESLALHNTSSSNTSSLYTEFSASFTLAGMAGSLSSPVASDTSSLAVPSSVSSQASSSDAVTSTHTIGSTSSLSHATSPTLSSSGTTSSSSTLTGLTTLTSPSSSSTTSTSASSTPTTTSSGTRMSVHPVALTLFTFLVSFTSL